MKHLLFPFLLLSCLSFGTISCDYIGMADEISSKGCLRIFYHEDMEYRTRTFPGLPDTCDFLLKITGPSGNCVFDGKFGDCPQSLTLDPGKYVVEVFSCAFERPAFDKPQFGDLQSVIVKSGETVDVRLLCTQMNVGVRLKIDSDFLECCPSAVLFLKSEQGKLLYSYSEKRTAYFHPGKISLVMSENGEDKVLMSRTLLPQEMLVLSVDAKKISQPEDGFALTVSVDTSRIWYEDELTVGESSQKGESVEEALNVAEARSCSGAEDVWVCGYIVGGDLSKTSASFEPPFQSRTNVIIASKPSVSDRESCLSVQLPAGDIRENLNLVDNPGNLRRKVFIKGDIVESYYGLLGLKPVTEFQLI